MPNQSNLPDTQASLLSAEQPKQAPIGIMAALEQEISCSKAAIMPMGACFGCSALNKEAWVSGRLD